MIKKISKFLLMTGICFLGLIITLHFVFNSQTFQRSLIYVLHEYLDLNLRWDDLRFNGATGRFSGTNLSLEIPKAKTTIHLNQFQILFEPFHLLIKKIHLEDLQADGLFINMEGFSPSQKKEEGPRPDPNIKAIFDIFYVNAATVKDIQITGPGGEIISLNSLEMISKSSIPFYKKQSMELKALGFQYLHEKLDMFLKELNISGSFGFGYNIKNQILEPDIKAQITVSELLIGFNKKPSPWNISKSWDERLNPVLQHYYPAGIPDHRNFAYMEQIRLPLTWKKELIKMQKGVLDFFGGQLGINGYWNKKNGNTNLTLSTEGPLKWALLPLGKSKIKETFEHVFIHLTLRGLFKSLAISNLQGNLEVQLQNNKIKPLRISELPTTVKLNSEISLKNGILVLPNLKIEMDQGYLQGNATLDLIVKKIQSHFNGHDLDSHTIVRFFSDIDIPGKADITGGIDGELLNPHFHFNISSSKFSYENLTMGSFDGKLDIKDKTLLLTGNSKLGAQGTGSIRLHITEVFRPSIQVLQLDTQFNHLPVTEVFDTKVASGNISGNFKMTKKQQDYDGGGEITASNVTWFQFKALTLHTKLKLDDKVLTLQPSTIQWTEQDPGEQVTKPLVFHFDPAGYYFEGNVLPTATIRGAFNKADDENLYLKFELHQTPLSFLTPLVPAEMEKIVASAFVEVTYNFKSPQDTRIVADLFDLNASSVARSVTLADRTKIEYQSKEFTFHPSSWNIGNQTLFIHGSLHFEKPSNLQIKGSLDLLELNGLQPYLTDSRGVVTLDLNFQGSLAEPSYKGTIIFKEATLFFFALGRELSDIKGSLRIDGNQLVFNAVQARFDEAPIKLDGSFAWTADKKISAAHLTLVGEELPLSKPDTWRILSDANLLLSGSGSQITLSGNLHIVDGLFYKDYNMTQFILKPIGVSHDIAEEAIPPVFQDVNLNLIIRSTGDFLVKNNLAKLALRSDLHLKGTLLNPRIFGNIDVLEGDIHVLGIDFEDAHGFLTFTGSDDLNPFVEFAASHAIQDYEVRAKIVGPLSNLRLELESTPAASHNEIISLIAYGRTPEQLSEQNRNLFSTTAIASQVVGMLQRPLSRATRLDIVRLESDFREDKSGVSRFSIGKQLSDRFSLAFTTDLSLDEAFKGVVIEYLILDNLLLKGTKDTGSRYRFDLTWRFETY